MISEFVIGTATLKSLFQKSKNRSTTNCQPLAGAGGKEREFDL